MEKKQRTIVMAMWVVTSLAAVALGSAIWLMKSNASAALSTNSMSAPTAELMPDPSHPTAAGLPVLFDAPSFALTDQNGKPFGSDDLRGKIWVADFIFTHCSGLCPMMTANMAEFQKRSAGSIAGSAVQMVSFSVDPEHDTPAALKEYAAAAKADESRWHFLTGTRAQTWEVSRGMKLAVGEDTGDQVMHSSHFLLVDGAGKVRGVYDSKDAGYMKKMLDDATGLANGGMAK